MVGLNLEDCELLAIVGATASGKSELAINIAVKEAKRGRKCHIINADSFSLYRKMDIGTAKTPLETREDLESRCGIRHYMIDVLDPTESANVAVYQREVLDIIRELKGAGVLPILVGGSGLYIRSVIDNFEFQSVDLNLRRELENRAATEGVEVLFSELERKDPETAKTVDPQNVRRIVRALEVLNSSAQKYANRLPEYVYRAENTVQIAIQHSREELDLKIEERTRRMRELGLEEEVRGLYQSGQLGETARKAIGYSEFIDYFEGVLNPANLKPQTLDDVFLRITQHTKRLVRRQESWFNRDPRIRFVQPQVVL
ncbi:MAG: tRNA (adenosine(37)-N6)-dimethylallyltransferase MiaA [Candidatus Ancillula sp.]|nr:tRNA (adenosine(37)-N6)-dimethylallyltransferase MiaA [Candidatus Ancillula sp.]